MSLIHLYLQLPPSHRYFFQGIFSLFLTFPPCLPQEGSKDCRICLRNRYQRQRTLMPSSQFIAIYLYIYFFNIYGYPLPSSAEGQGVNQVVFVQMTNNNVWLETDTDKKSDSSDCHIKDGTRHKTKFTKR